MANHGGFRICSRAIVYWLSATVPSGGTFLLESFGWRAGVAWFGADAATAGPHRAMILLLPANEASSPTLDRTRALVPPAAAEQAPRNAQRLRLQSGAAPAVPPRGNRNHNTIDRAPHCIECSSAVLLQRRPDSPLSRKLLALPGKSRRGLATGSFFYPKKLLRACPTLNLGCRRRSDNRDQCAGCKQTRDFFFRCFPCAYEETTAAG
jgi:hypothetical protein